MPKPTDIHPTGATLYFLPVETRVPLKFGPETLTSVTCARVRLRVESADGRRAEGWGETPLSVQWVWPSRLTYAQRHEALKAFTRSLTAEWARFEPAGHPIEVAHAFLEGRLPTLLADFNAAMDAIYTADVKIDEPMLPSVEIEIAQLNANEWDAMEAFVHQLVEA